MEPLLSTDLPLADYGRPADASDDPHAPAPAALQHTYDASFAVTADYQASLPDVMSQADEREPRPAVPIQQVGIAGFELPLQYRVAPPQGQDSHSGETHGSNGAHHENGDGSSRVKSVSLKTRVSGTVALLANLRAINMSRIIRTFYEFQDEVFTVDTLPVILARLHETVGSQVGRLRLDFSFPMLQRSLRSGLAGYQYYDASFEAELARGDDGRDQVRRWLRCDYLYSSACPCSAQLAEHARESRGVYAIPHSQRSRARVWVEVAPEAHLAIEDLQAACLRALQTETQVMVRRSDEQAFAELNGAHVKFVEDATRLLYRELAAETRVRDFQVVSSHQESLHSHDAVAVICKGVAGGFRGDFSDFGALGC